MKSCIEAVRAFFDARTRVWLTCDATLLEGFLEGDSRSKWLDRAVHQAERKQRAYAAQGKRLSRTHTNVHILNIETVSNNKSATVTSVEQICWAYHDKLSAAVECRQIYHRQIWHYVNHQWVIHKAEETSDGKSFFQDETSAASPDTARLPVFRARAAGQFDRVRATRYADVWWDSANPHYPMLGDDCTNFISQCLHAGGLPMTGIGDRNKGWWMQSEKAASNRWSYSWTTSQALYLYLRKSLQAELLKQPSELKMGDLIFYDWDGAGSFHHTTIVTDFDDAGDPLVNAHTDPSFHRPYTYYDSRAWKEQTRYAFVHLPDVLTQK